MSTPTEDAVKASCAVSYCTKPGKTRGEYKGYCAGHSQQIRRGTPVLPLVDQRGCLFPGCGQPTIYRNGKWCEPHSLICHVDDCVKPSVGHNKYCYTHASRKAVHGDPLKTVNRAAGTGTDWYVNRYGYLVRSLGLQPDGARPQVSQHRLVMEQVLGRALRPGETVHHMNGVKTDNRPENLELWTSRQPHGQRVIDLLAEAHRIIDLYGDLG